MGIKPMQNGVVKALRQALARLQCEIKPDLQVVDTWGRTLHVCHSPIQEWDLSLKEQLADLARYMTRSDMQCVDKGFDVVWDPEGAAEIQLGRSVPPTTNHDRGSHTSRSVASPGRAQPQ